MTYTEAKTAIESADRDTLETALKEFDEEIILAAIACDVQLSDIGEAYQGEHNSDEEFVQQLLEDTGGIPKDLPTYIHINWERTAHDIMMDYSEDNHHYFRNL